MSEPLARQRLARTELACRIYQARLDRTRFFEWQLFSDSAWDTLLAIYVFAASGRTLSASELADAACDSSATSALRMQRRLVDIGLVRRIAHQSDRRRVLIELTNAGETRLEAYLDHLLDRKFAPHQ